MRNIMVHDEKDGMPLRKRVTESFFLILLAVATAVPMQAHADRVVVHHDRRVVVHHYHRPVVVERGPRYEYAPPPVVYSAPAPAYVAPPVVGFSFNIR